VFVAASTRCFAEMDFWQALDQIADLEFDRVEVWLDENGSLKPSEVTASADEFVARLRDRTRLSPIAFTLANEVAASEFQALCRIASTLRVSQIVIPSSPIGTPFNMEIDRLKTLTAMASAHGIRLGLKTQSGRLTGDAHTAVELCQAVDRLGLAFDPSYFLNPKTCDAIVEMVSPYTLHVHMRDSTQNELQVQVGLGELDYSKLIAQLERYHYQRALSIELLPELTAIDSRLLELRKLRMLLDSLL